MGYNVTMTVTTAATGDRLLVVDDDQDIRDMIVEQLASAGYAVQATANVAATRALLARESIDLIVLDLTLPDGDGIALCRELRAEGYEASIIMVTARDAAPDRVAGLETGADDYLSKPFDPRELLVRIRNLLRRARGKIRPRGAQYALFGPWKLDLIRRRLSGPDGGLVMLSTSEFDILSRFIEHPNEPISRDELIPERSATAWADRSPDNRVSRLRHKLAQIPGGEGLIVTIRHRGYMLASPVTFV